MFKPFLICETVLCVVGYAVSWHPKIKQHLLQLLAFKQQQDFSLKADLQVGQ